jgi:hypothetical protein
MKDEFERIAEAGVRIMTAQIKSAAVAMFQLIREDSRKVSLAYGSAVRTGEFAASNRIALNMADVSVERPAPRGTRGRVILNAPLNDAVRSISTFKLGDRIILSNSTPHAQDIEHGVASPRKAPHGVFAYTLNGRAVAEAASLLTDIKVAL